MALTLDAGFLPALRAVLRYLVGKLCTTTETCSQVTKLGARSDALLVADSVAHLLQRFLHLLRTHIPDMGADRPLMTEWVFYFAISIAPEHVVEWHRDFRARGYRLLEDGVRV